MHLFNIPQHVVSLLAEGFIFVPRNDESGCFKLDLDDSCVWIVEGDEFHLLLVGLEEGGAAKRGMGQARPSHERHKLYESVHHAVQLAPRYQFGVPQRVLHPSILVRETVGH